MIFLLDTLEDEFEVSFLLLLLSLAPTERRIPTDIRLPTLVLEINLRLIERGLKKIVFGQFDAAGARRRAHLQPIQSQRVAA